MKACKKCRVHNEVSAKFCFQCGTKLSTIASGFQVPVPSNKSSQSWMSPVDPVDFITHPMQRREDVITSLNQGRQVAPGLAAKLGFPEKQETFSKQDMEQTKLNTSKIRKTPIISQNSLDKPNLKPRGLTDPAKSPVKAIESSPKSIKIPQEVASRHQISKGLQRKPLLEDADRILLQTIMPSRSVSGLKPSGEMFAMKDVVSIQERKEEIQKIKLREKKVQEDLAYLDQILPFGQEGDNGVLDGPPVHEQEVVAIPLSKKSMSAAPPVAPSAPHTGSAASLLEDQKIAAKIELRKTLKKEISSSSIDQELHMVTSGEAVYVESPRAIHTQGWLQMIQGVRQRTPSEQLKGYEHGDSSEFITPFLTLAAFIYFCYVLYI